MQRASFQRWCLGTLVLGLLVGCQDGGLTSGLFEDSQAPENQTDPGSQVDPGSQTDLAESGSGNDLAAEAQAHAQRVAAVGAATRQPQQILWTDLGGRPEPGASADHAVHVARPQPTTVTPSNTVAETRITTAAQANDSPPAHVAVTPPPQVEPVQPAAIKPGEQLTQKQMYDQFIAAVRRGDDSNMSKAVTAATLAAIGPHGELDWTMLSKLSPKDQEMVQGYHRSLVTLRGELLAGNGKVDREAVTSRLDELFGSQPVTIRTVKLCEKVMGYGVYDSFPDEVFVAGREQKLIVYVELDNFESAARDSGDGYEVRLRQEVELYESSGFEVWSHEPVKIVDVSRNKRRDFFVVQLVTLPAQLSMGEYHLKIRVYDENASTRDETSVTIRIVADGAKLSQAGR